jgi:putative transposase
VFADEMPTFAENTMRATCAELDTELVEFNGDTDHVNLPVQYPPTLAISTLVQRLKGHTAGRYPSNGAQVVLLDDFAVGQ